MRKICYVSGTRADFGLMKSALLHMHSDPRLKLGLLVTGMHLSALYGETVCEIRAAGLQILREIPVEVDNPTRESMARGIATMLSGFVDSLLIERPDVVLLLGDRGEMLAAAIAAIHLGIPIAHIHGGERSGSVDEPVRHAISKLAHLHFVATSQARDRLVRMGENPAHIWVTGAPGLDGLTTDASFNRVSLCVNAGLDAARPIALCVFHPVVNTSENLGLQFESLVSAALATGCQVLALEPNSDAGAGEIRAALERLQATKRVVARKHLERPLFVSWMAQCDVMIGNSSSGIIEAATFGTPVVNVGSRQNLRESGTNVINVDAEPVAMRQAIAGALRDGRFRPSNIYGDGSAGKRIVELLVSAELGQKLLAKCNAY